MTVNPFRVNPFRFMPTGPQGLPDDIKECAEVLRGCFGDDQWVVSYQEHLAATWQVLDYLGVL